MGWIMLFAVTIATPIHFFSYRLRGTTILFCVLWVGVFVLGNVLGNITFPRSRVYKRRRAPIGRMRLLSFVGFFGMAWLIYNNRYFLSKTVDDPYAVAIQRFEYSSGSNIWNTLAIFVALVGAIIACREIVGAVIEKRTVRIAAYLGMADYLVVYVVGAGRQGFLLLGIAISVSLFASLQFVRFDYPPWRKLLFPLLLMALLAIGYNSFIITFRSTGFTGNMVVKMQKQDILYDSAVSGEFKGFVETTGVFGSLIAESFYYFSPQLYGLDYTLHGFKGENALGAYEFPYIYRRLDDMFGENSVDTASGNLDELYENRGLFHHFFRTAVEDVYIDFGLIPGLAFVLVCGLGCGLAHRAAVEQFTPENVCLVALLCAGSFFTIIFSPFSENGFAFPLIWMAGLKMWAVVARSCGRRVSTHIGLVRLKCEDSESCLSGSEPRTGESSGVIRDAFLLAARRKL